MHQLASLVGSALGQSGFYAAALKHLELAGQLAAEELKQNSSLIRSLRMNPAISLWEKNPYRLWPAPEQATEPFRESFERALGVGQRGALVVRRHRRSSYWPPVPGPVRSPIAIGACVACGSPITRARSPRCGATSRAPAPRSTRSSSRPFARRSTAVHPTIKSNSFT